MDDFYWYKQELNDFKKNALNHLEDFDRLALIASRDLTDYRMLLNEATYTEIANLYLKNIIRG